MKPFQIVKWVPEKENWKVLESFNTYDDADERYDYYSEKYPNSWIEITDPLV